MRDVSYSNGTHSSGAFAAKGLPASAPPLVLIVEDHEDTRLMLRTILELRGIRVMEAEDGEGGVCAAEALRPDLILMDGSLPRLDGLAAMRRLREREDGRKVPIVFVSGHAAPKAQAEAFAAGCDDYLVKPFNFDKLYRVLECHLHIKWLVNCEATS